MGFLWNVMTAEHQQLTDCCIFHACTRLLLLLGAWLACRTLFMQSFPGWEVKMMR